MQAGSEAGEGSNQKHNAETERTWLLQGVVQQVLTALGQIGECQVEEGDGGAGSRKYRGSAYRSERLRRRFDA